MQHRQNRDIFASGSRSPAFEPFLDEPDFSLRRLWLFFWRHFGFFAAHHSSKQGALAVFFGERRAAFAALFEACEGFNRKLGFDFLPCMTACTVVSENRRDVPVEVGERLLRALADAQERQHSQ